MRRPMCGKPSTIFGNRAVSASLRVALERVDPQAAGHRGAAGRYQPRMGGLEPYGVWFAERGWRHHGVPLCRRHWASILVSAATFFGEPCANCMATRASGSSSSPGRQPGKANSPWPAPIPLGRGPPGTTTRRLTRSRCPDVRRPPTTWCARFDAQDFPARHRDRGRRSILAGHASAGPLPGWEGEPGCRQQDDGRENPCCGAGLPPWVRLQCYEVTDRETRPLYDWNYQRQLLSIRLAGGAAAPALEEGGPVHRDLPDGPPDPAVCAHRGPRHPRCC